MRFAAERERYPATGHSQYAMQPWKIAASPEQIDKFRGDPAFAEILTLGRIANLLRAALHTAAEQGGKVGTVAERARIAMTLLLTGLVAEAIPVLERSGEHFRHLPGFKGTVKPVLDDPTIRDLRDRWFAPMRNQAVFHNDKVVSKDGLSLLKPSVRQDLARGSTSSFLDAYYPMADVVAILYIIQKAGAVDDPGTFLENAISTVVSAATNVCLAIDTLIGQALERLGFQLEEVGGPPS